MGTVLFVVAICLLVIFVFVQVLVWPDILYREYKLRQNRIYHEQRWNEKARLDVRNNVGTHETKGNVKETKEYIPKKERELRKRIERINNSNTDEEMKQKQIAWLRKQ